MELKIWRKRTRQKILRETFIQVPSDIEYEESIKKYYNSNEVGYISRASWVRYLQSIHLNAFYLEVYPVAQCLLTVLCSHSYSCDFPYVVRFQQLFSRFEESGLVLFWEKSFTKPRDKQLKNSTYNRKALSFEDLKGAILLWCCGIIISLVSFSAECLYSQYFKNKNRI